jgi:hypothetical protein
MRSATLYASTLCLLLGTLTAGCAGTGAAADGTTVRRGTADYSSRTVLDTSVDSLRPIAQRVFRDHFRLDAEASSDNVLVSRPEEIAGRGQSRQIRDRIGLSPSRQRELAELRLQQEGDNVVVRCSVITQRLQTAERASFMRERGDDRPTDTPIDRMGATSANPREDWVNMGRDRDTEREVLDAIQGVANTGTAEVSAPATAPAP